MVRTKKGPAVSKGSKVHRDGGKYIRHNRIFNDHTGKPALMLWSAPERDGLLPPLSSWIYYIVHPDVPHDFNGNALHWGLTLPLSIGQGSLFRYEYFFLPGATAEEYHAHFLREIKAQGTIWRHIRKVNRAIELKKQESGPQEEEDSYLRSASDEEDSKYKLHGFIGQTEYKWVHNPSSNEDYANY